MKHAFFERANFDLLQMLLPQADLVLTKKGIYDYLKNVTLVTQVAFASKLQRENNYRKQKYCVSNHLLYRPLVDTTF